MKWFLNRMVPAWSNTASGTENGRATPERVKQNESKEHRDLFQVQHHEQHEPDS